jgi:MFS family permease
LLFACSKTYWLSLLLLVPAGLSIMIQLGSTNTLIQSIVGNAMRGRVMGIYSMMFLGMAPFGSLIAGFLAQHFGAPAAVFCCGAASVAGAIVFEIMRRRLRIDDHLSSSALQAQADARA